MTENQDRDRLEAERLLRLITPKWNKYIPGVPNPKQHVALCLDHVEEVFFGGAAGPGKSWWLMASAVQYVDHPDYDALLIRRNFPDLAQPGGLIDVSHEWFDSTDASWNEGLKRWTFPSGATISFGHMDDKDSFKRYRGGEYQFVGIDELTDFDQRSAMFLHSRLRRRAGSSVPIRFRAASNPGGTGHVWVKERYVDYKGTERVFVPAVLWDNPNVDHEAYLRRLANLDPITRERLIKGDWSVVEGGHIFNRSWWKTFLEAPPVLVGGRIRAWDLAATVSDDAKETAGVRMSVTYQGLFVIEHVVHGKWFPGDRDDIIVAQAHVDTHNTKVILEEEPGSGGKAQNAAIIKKLAGYRAKSERVTGDKYVRAGALASQVQAGNVALVKGTWNADFIEQLHAADPENDKLLIDMMDAASLAFTVMAPMANRQYPVEVPDKQNLTEEEREALETEAEEAERHQRDRNKGIYERTINGENWEGVYN